MRRLPVYLLIDTSGSMKGEPIESVKVGLEAMIASLRQDPFALESINISIITFDSSVNQLLPLTELENLQLPEIVTPDSGPTHLGAALELLCKVVDKEVQLSTPDRKGDWMPLLFIMTDGKPSDIQLYNQIIPEVKKKTFCECHSLCRRYACPDRTFETANRSSIFFGHSRQFDFQAIL